MEDRLCEPYGTCGDEQKRFNDNTINPEANQCCPNNNPFVDFAGFKWWTNYHWSKETGLYVWEPFKTFFDPTLVSVNENGLRLSIGKPQDRQNCTNLDTWRTAEVCTADKLGFGKYLFTANSSEASLGLLDPHVIFGAFTYQYYGDAQEPNCHRELDLLEVIAPHPDPDNNPCKVVSDGNNAQFTIQPYLKLWPKAAYRFFIPHNVFKVTAVMDWRKGTSGRRAEVTYALYYGDYTLDNLPPSPAVSWSPGDDPSLSDYVPVPGCQRFHLNLWLMHGCAPNNGKESSVTISRFQFRPY
jgi:hypothetical protein